MADSTIEDDKTIFESHIKNIAIPNDVKVAYILCPGMGNNTINVYYTHHGNHYELFNYGAEDSVMGYCSDVICLIRDILSLRKNEITGKNPLNAIEAKIGRLKRLVTRIKLLLISPDQYARVVLLGLSHGALLMYGAILRLLCDVELNRSHYEKLRIFTVGAPIYPPSTLLLPYEKDQSINLLNILNNYNRQKPPPKNNTVCVNLYNIYHKLDGMLNNTNKVKLLQIVCKLRNPFVLKLKMSKYNVNIDLSERIILHDICPTRGFYHAGLYNLNFIFYRFSNNPDLFFERLEFETLPYYGHGLYEPFFIRTLGIGSQLINSPIYFYSTLFPK